MAHEINRLPHIERRNPETHKGTFGRVSIIGGSLGMAGAVMLAGEAALRSGAGLVDCTVPERIADIVSSSAAHSLLINVLDSAEDGTFSEYAARNVLDAVSSSTVLAAGPGMGTSAGSRAVTKKVVSKAEIPLILDADGLNCCAAEGTEALKSRTGNTILTPHPGEMSRLTDKPVHEIQNKRLETAVRFASEYSSVVVLKGHRTVVTDGENYYINRTGNPGMAAGGSGDVLTGVIAGILASADLSPFEAACAGVWVHGTAGDLGAERRGEISLAPEDTLNFISGAFQKYPAC